jgi:penicillin-binding protein A
MNTPLRRVGLAMLAMLVLLLGNVTYIQMVNADDYRTDSRNNRVLYDEYSRERGKIISADGRELLAKVTPTNDRLRYQREYPFGPAMAPVTGFYSVRFGSRALEKSEDEILNGSDDRLFVRRLSDLITGRDPRGGNIQTTVIPQVQQAAYDAMSKKNFTGAVVALRPQTGEILAMVSTPSYDPNPLSSHSSDEQEKYINTVRDENNPAKPMLNRAIQETYQPGSTFKLVVAAAALEDGKDKNYLLPADASIQLPGTRTTDLENFAHSHCGPADQTQVPLETALALSCNTAFATLADQVGRDKLLEQAQKFGIGQTDLQIPMGVATSGIGKLPDRAALFQTGIGQRDVNLTPMQDAMIAAAIANNGTVMRPQLVQKVLAPDLQVISEFDADELDRAMSGSNANELRDMMKKSEENTKGDGKVPGLVIASKTGTAEHGVNPKATPPHAWYVAFAPADNPQIAVAVVVENGGDRGLAATGGSVAASVGRATINALPGIGGR